MADWDAISSPAGDDWDSVSRPAQGRATPARKRSWQDNVGGFMANLNSAIPFADEVAAAGGAAVNVFRGIPGGLSGAMAAQRQAQDSFNAAHPNAAAVARGVGMAGTAAVPVGASASLFANSGRVVNAARGATLAAGQGAIYAGADRGTASERLGAASRAARDPLTLALGGAGGALATNKTPKRAPKVSDDVKLLASEGVTMTPGQMGGRLRRSAEDASTSLPVLGDAVADRRVEGVQTFNRAVVNRALKPIGEKLPADIQAGTAAVKHAGDKLSDGYKDAVPGVVVRADRELSDDFREALSNIDTLTPKSFSRVENILNQRVTSRIPKGGAIDGTLYKKIQSELDFEVERFSKSTDADERAIGSAIEGVQTSLEKMARRQDPKFAARIDALDRGWAELGRIETAAAKSTDLSGVFTPPQYANSIRSADSRVRRRGVARGEALSQDLAGAGVRVLPSKMPDSGTPGRAAWGMVAAAPGAALGAVTGGGVGALAGIAGTGAGLAAMSTRYSPKAIEAANKALSGRISGSDKSAALNALRDMAANDPAVRELYQQVAARLTRAAGVAGGAQAESAPNVFARP